MVSDASPVLLEADWAWRYDRDLGQQSAFGPDLQEWRTRRGAVRHASLACVELIGVDVAGRPQPALEGWHHRHFGARRPGKTAVRRSTGISARTTASLVQRQ